MKFHIIRIEDTDCPAHEKSCEAAERCAKSLEKFGMEYTFFPAYTPESDYVKEMMSNKSFLSGFRGAEKYARPDRCVAAHLSHRTLWQMCYDNQDGPIGILEHDAVMVREMPNYLKFRYFVNLGKPSYGKFREAKMSGVHGLFSKRYFPGAHAYAINPAAMNMILKRKGGDIGGPTDTYLSSDQFILDEHYPWIFEADDRFSSIQAERGCRAKHNQTKEYQRL
jgi:GR25 family glycosyltransferase involved in LPS biosynthesis